MKKLFLLFALLIVLRVGAQTLYTPTDPESLKISFNVNGVVRYDLLSDLLRKRLRVIDTIGFASRTWVLSQGYSTGAGGGGTAGVSSFNSRTGAVVPLLADYSSFYAALVHQHDTTTATTGYATKGYSLNLANGKVDKVAAKQLSTEDYTTAEKTKLAGVATGATNVTNNNQLTNGSNFITATALTPYLLKTDSTTYSTKANTTKVRDSLQANINTKQGTLSFTTNGTSGPATLTGNALNIPNYATGSGGGTNPLGWFNILSYGADSTGVTDASSAINAAITAAIGNNGTVYLPHGTYKIASTIHWSTYVNLRGENWASTILKASTAGVMLDCNGQNTIKENTATISNIQFDGNSIGTVALDLRFQIKFRHDHLFIHHFTSYATKLTGCIAGEFNTCHWVMNTNGAIQGVKGTDAINGTMQSNAMLFTNCLINFTTNAFAVDWADAAGLFFTNNCTMENNGTSGNAATGFINYTNASPTGEGVALVLDNCWAEMNKGTFIKMNNAQSENRTIINNSIIKFGSATYNIYLTGDNGNKNIVTISNSNINDATTNVYATGVNAVVEVQNSLIGNFTMANSAKYYQYQPTLIATGTGSTNLFTNPRALNLWTGNAVTMTANATTSADGTTNADKMAATTTSAVHFVNQSITKAASTITYTVGVDVKPSNVSLFEVNVTTAANNGVIGKYNVTTGAVVAAPVAYGSGFTVGASSITALANGFYRIQITLTSNSETDLGVYFALSGTFAGNGTDGVFLDNASLQ